MKLSHLFCRRAIITDGMINNRGMIVCSTLLACVVSVIAIRAEEPPASATRMVALETRVLTDSAGCPAAIEIWLSRTTDTIQGFEAVLQWDRPDVVHFRRGLAAAEPKTASDSLGAMLRPNDPKSLIPLRKDSSLVSKWELVQARSADGISAKLVAVAKVLRQDDIAPILPGASGLLMTLPIVWLPASGPDSLGADSLAVHYSASGTRFSTFRGQLFDRVDATGVKTAAAACRPK